MNVYDYVLLTTAISAVVLRSEATARFNAVAVASIGAMYCLVIIHQVTATSVIIAPALVALVYLYINRGGGKQGNLAGFALRAPNPA